MATDTLSPDSTAKDASRERPRNASNSLPPPLAFVRYNLLAPLASLKLTVSLFAMATFIILVGTLAQDEKDIWEVMTYYFRAWWTWIAFDVFVPQPFYAHDNRVPGGFYFPGGALIGAAMMVNLLSAHTIWLFDMVASQARRRKSQSTALRLMAGVVVTLLGVGAAALIIASGHNAEGLQDAPPFEWRTLWTYCQVALGLLWLVGLYALFTVTSLRGIARSSLIVALVLVGGGLLASVAFGLYPGEPAMRVTWQLIKGELSALILLAGLVLLFQKRGGLVLLHGGVALLMLGEVFVSFWAVEEQITVREGQTANYAQDIRTTELAIVNPAYSDKEDEVVAIPHSRLIQSLRSDAVISDEALPFDLKVTRYEPNADLVPVKDDQENPATDGTGKKYVIQPVRTSSGADSSGAVDLAAAYITVYPKGSSEAIGTFLVSQILAVQDMAEKIPADDTTYEASLRFKRTYKPYSITLHDVTKEDYPGTSVPRYYSSDIRLIDPSRNIDIDRHIWMNNPLRYAGETFYQSSYAVDRDGVEVSTLQVVTNTGWLIPYVACMIVATGMVTHFSITLTRFLKRHAEGRIPTGDSAGPKGAPGDMEEIELIGAIASEPVGASTGAAVATRPKSKSARKRQRSHEAAPAAPPPALARSGPGVATWLPWGAVALAAFMLMMRAMPPGHDPDEFNYYEFGKLPVLHEGRVKPLDTLARNSLRAISDRESYVDSQKKKQPAIRWLLNIAANTPEARQIEMFRIHNGEILETLQLDRREGFRYSIDDLIDNIGEFERQAQQARKLDEAKLTFYQKKLLELERRIHVFTLLRASLTPADIPPMPSREELEENPEKAEAVMRALGQARQAAQELANMRPPRTTPIAPSGDEEESSAESEWLPLAAAWPDAYVKTALAEIVNPGAENTANPPTIYQKNMLDAYAADSPRKFNESLAKYQAWLQENEPARYSEARVNGEARFNKVDLFGFCQFLYILGFVAAAGSWLGWTRPLNRTAFALIAFTFALHTVGLIARIYFSGRPPVTNLYSSAIFIGWACVGFGLVLERIYRLGIGSIVASVAGFSTLLIAYYLAADGGDTMAVLQAVLDTNFWLTIHVLCISAGYSATFVAGLLGVLYIFRNLISPWAPNVALDKNLVRMMYGVACFAILFSFVGTVTGGLWADDSWGRFWGWDPKENGALMIVLWNALVLHARWGGIVKDRGLAALLVGGNMVTAWSWFGVNQLGIGLHSYGFTEGVLLALLGFYVTQMAVIAIPITLFILEKLGLWHDPSRSAGA